jgi:hypothetical protein
MARALQQLGSTGNLVHVGRQGAWVRVARPRGGQTHLVPSRQTIALDPGIVGHAACSGQHSEQAVKRVWHYVARFGTTYR